MLVLTRKPGERIFVGDDIVVTLVAIRRDDHYGDRIRIGLEAPSHVLIRREEVPDQRETAQPVPPESGWDALEGESLRVRQKIEALRCQIARRNRQAAPEAQHAGEVLDELISLRRTCDELLDQLGKIVTDAEPT